MLTKEDKLAIAKKYSKKGKNISAGSVPVQIALLTARITYLNDHFKTHKKDHASRRSLFKIVNQRRKFLRYLQNTNIQGYRDLIQDLGLRK